MKKSEGFNSANKDTLLGFSIEMAAVGGYLILGFALCWLMVR